MKNHRLPAFIPIGILGFILMSVSANAQDISRRQAAKTGTEIITKYFPSDWQGKKNSIEVRTDNNTNLPFYICDVEGGGFVLVGKNENMPRVLGFSYESAFPGDISKLPDHFSSYLGAVNMMTSKEPEKDIGHSLKSGFIPPLIKTKWEIDSSFCAEFPEGSQLNSSAVIAMGQVFRYYEEPNMGIGEYCYLYGPGQEEICTLFDFTFDFSTMPDNSADAQVTRLLYYMAVLGKLQPEGADLNTYIETMPEYFFYSNNMRRIDYWEHDFISVIKYQLAKSRPVLAEWKGHSFIIDGYYDNNFFHFNFGDGGELDGFYSMEFSNVTTDKDHILLSCYINYHPESKMPAPQSLNMIPVGDSLIVNWSINLPDSLLGELNSYVLLRDGVIPVLETQSNTVTVHPSELGVSSKINCLAVYDTYGLSELSEAFRYISDYTLADIPSLELRQAINIQLGYTEDLNRIPYVGELEMVKKLEIDFQDQRGIEQLTELRNLFVDGITIGGIVDGEYLHDLTSIYLHRCRQFDFTVLESTNSLNVINGSDGLPYDFFDLRHNTNTGVIVMASHDDIQNNLGDLYGVDRYFPSLNYFDLYHITFLSIDSCYISYESYNDFLPIIKGNGPAMEHTSPSSFAPCYPSPARNTNVPNTGQISWQSNFNDEPNVFYNVYIGKTRDQLALVAPFITTNVYDYNFENNLDYYWRVESFHNDTTYYSGIYHFSTLETFPMPYEEDFDDFYGKCDVAYESPWWVNFGDVLPEPCQTNREIKRSGRYSLEFPENSDAGIVLPSNPDSAYQLGFYFRNNRAEFGIELLQGSNEGDTLAVNSRLSLFGENLGKFDTSEGDAQFLFTANEWNHALFRLDVPMGSAELFINEEKVWEWLTNKQLDGTDNSNPFRGIRFSNEAEIGTGMIDDLVIDFMATSGLKEIEISNSGIRYSPMAHELILDDNIGLIKSVELFDMRGRKIITFAPHGEQTLKLDESMKNGLFIVRINKMDGKVLIEKIAIQR